MSSLLTTALILIGVMILGWAVAIGICIGDNKNNGAAIGFFILAANIVLWLLVFFGGKS